jgi:nucleotidyltransferase substrate binding protein (TIGR01987 family)
MLLRAPMTDVRWKQRLQNFDRAFVLLRSGLESKELAAFTDLEREGLIQRFEYTYELAWKTLKDYLEEGGVLVNPVTPRNVIKEAFAAKILADGQLWIDMMLDRNRLSHTYDFLTFTSVLEAVVKRYFPALDALHEWLLAKSVQP